MQSLCHSTVVETGTERYIFDMRSKQIYVGLLDKIVQFCNQYGYTYTFEDNKFYGTPYEENEFISYEGVKDYIKSICSHSPTNTKLKEYMVL